MKRRFWFVMVWAALTVTAWAQPGGRNKPGFASDEARRKFVLFGGFGTTDCKMCGDTWYADRCGAELDGGIEEVDHRRSHPLVAMTSFRWCSSSAKAASVRRGEKSRVYSVIRCRIGPIWS